MYTLIYEINNKKLKKPIKVKIIKYYTIENENFHEEGSTKQEAIDKFKNAVLELYEDMQSEGIGVELFEWRIWYKFVPLIGMIFD